MEQPNPTPEVSSNDRLLGLLDYILSPIVPIIFLLMPDKKNNPFLREHNVQALVTGIVVSILVSILAPITCGIGLLGWAVMIYLGIQAYQGKTVNIPVITDFVKNQGWA
jgi:uncharacterized protein